MKIGDLAQQAGVSRDTIRFYERNGLIRSTASTEPSNNYREYSGDIVERLRMIKEAQHAGFSLSDLKVFFQQAEGDAPFDFDADVFFQTKIDEVSENIRRAQQFLTVLKTTRQALRGPH